MLVAFVFHAGICRSPGLSLSFKKNLVLYVVSWSKVLKLFFFRPPWNTRMSVEELDVNERQAFLAWRRNLARSVLCMFIDILALLSFRGGARTSSVINLR